MRRDKWRKIALWLGVLLVAMLSHRTSIDPISAAPTAPQESLYAIGAEQNHLIERATHTALIPETYSIVGTNLSRTHSQRQRTNHQWQCSVPLVGFGVVDSSDPTVGTLGSQRGEFWRTTDYYVYALRHIII